MLHKFAALVLIGVGSCLAQDHAISVGPSAQPGAPVRFVSTHHGLVDALLGGKLQNSGDKAIKSYRVGWATAVDGKVSLHEAEWVTPAEAIGLHQEAQVPDQQIALDKSSRIMLFYISEVRYKDGSAWSANASDLVQEAESRARFRPS